METILTATFTNNWDCQARSRWKISARRWAPSSLSLIPDSHPSDRVIFKLQMLNLRYQNYGNSLLNSFWLTEVILYLSTEFCMRVSCTVNCLHWGNTNSSEECFILHEIDWLRNHPYTSYSAYTRLICI